MKAYFLDDGSKILIDDQKPIGSGGEGSVFKLAKNANVLVKIYSDRALERMPDIEHKIKAMVQKKPGLLDYNGLTIIAWPSYVIYDDRKRFVGYLMRRVQAKNQLSHVITPGLQKDKFPHITWYDRLVIAINLAKVMSFLHKNDTVIGDINTSDFFVYPGFEIGVVDTDSFQITADRKLYHCKVFTPDYTPPEVIEAKKHTSQEVKRLPDHDNYGLAILIFQILMMGVHPFSARIRHTMGFDGNAINYNMEREIFPYHTANPNIIPPKNAMPFSFLPKHLQDLFIRAFDKQKDVINRPTADEWVASLKHVKDEVKKCRRHKAHYYPPHFQKCPICAREQTKDYDYLIEYFKTISKKYVTYETDDKPIIVDENHIHDQTIVSKSYVLKKPDHIAVFFNDKMLQKYKLDQRIEKVRSDKALEKLAPYVQMPERLIYDQSKRFVIGYTCKKREPVYRLQDFVKHNRLGKSKITDKTKIQLARNIAQMFSVLEKNQIYVEFNHIYVNKDLQPSLADVCLMGTSDGTLKPMNFQREDYLPQEYHLMEAYQTYLKEIEAEKEAEREKERKRIEAERLKDLELIKSPFEKMKEKKEKKPEEKIIHLDEPDPVIETFEFEKSHEAIVEVEEVPERIIPPNVTYDPMHPQVIRYHLAVIIHLILQEGHPFKGTYQLANKPIGFFVQNNYYLHKNTVPKAEIDVHTTIIEQFSNDYQKTMKKALIIKDPLAIRRPSPAQWSTVLTKMLYDVQKCDRSEYHYYPQNLTACPVCHANQFKDHDARRTFILEHKKGTVHRMLFVNKLLNYVTMSAIVLGLIYLVNQYSLTNLDQMLSDINIQAKIDEVRIWIRYDQIIDGLSGIFRWFQSVFESIFGGVNHVV